MKKTNSKKVIKIVVLSTAVVAVLATSFLISLKMFSNNSGVSKNQESKNPSSSSNSTTTSEQTKTPPIKEDTKKDIEVVLSSAGDCTLGTDDKFSVAVNLPTVLQKQNNNYSYFFKNVVNYFKEDDITIVNLETTLTNANTKVAKPGNVTYNFRGKPEYASALSSSSIEGVNLSNNHINDYGKQGFDDTIKALKAENISYFGESYKWIKEVNGVKFGFLGYRGFSYSKSMLDSIKADITALKKENCVVIINFHWGIEGDYKPNETQKYLAHYAIDNGADLIIGHHPHVIQGVEKYKDRFIYYSLGNFCFGGNSNPSDKDTFIGQTKFKFSNNKLASIGIKVIPCSISSVSNINDYCPTPLNGDKKIGLLNKLNNISFNLGFKLSDEYTEIKITE